MIARGKIRFRSLHCRLLTPMVLLFLFLFVFTVQGQFTQDWDILYGGDNFDELLSVVEVSDGLVFGGSANSSTMGDSPPTAGSSDYWIYKTDFDGNILWSYAYGGFSRDILQNLIQTADGGFIMTGISESNMGAFKSEDSRGDVDFWIVKVDADGLFTWDATFGGDQEDFSTTIIQVQDGTYYASGWTQSLVSGEVSFPTRGGSSDYWLVHIDTNGDLLYDRRIGGPNADLMLDMYEVPGGDIILSGVSSSNIGGEKTEDSYGSNDVWVIRMNADGSIDWDRTYGGTQDEQGWSIGRAPDGGTLIGAFSNSPVSGNKTANQIGGSDYWLIKIDDLGNKVYDRTFGGLQEDELNELKVNDKGLYVLGGRSSSNIGANKSELNRGAWDYWVIIVDDDGNVFFDKTLGGDQNDLLQDFELLDGGGIVCAGFTASDTSGDITDMSNGFNDNWVVLLECSLDQFLNIGDDQMVCEFTTEVLSSNTGQLNICGTVWNDGRSEVDRTFFIDEDMTISVTVNDLFGCIAQDTVEYTIFDAPEFDLGSPEIEVCVGEDTLLTTGLDDMTNSFEWNDGNQSSERDVLIPGTYELTVTDLIGCTFADTVRLENFDQPSFDLGADLVFCDDASMILTVSDPGPNYEWSVPNGNSPTLEVTETGEYFVTVTNSDGCSSIDSVNVTVNATPGVELGLSRTICEDDVVRLDASVVGCPSCTYAWDDMSTNPLRDVSPGFNTTYEVVVTDNTTMCTSTDQITVNVLSKSLVRINDVTCNPSEMRNDTMFSVNEFGCDSLTIFNIVLLPSDTMRFSVGVCDTALVGRDTIVDTNRFGCDSLNIFNFFPFPTSIENISGGTCNPNEVGIDTMIFVNEFGCDSIIIQELTPLPSSENTFNFVSCDSDEVGRDTMRFINEFGCDSIIINVTDRILADTILLNEPVCFPEEVGMDTMFFINDVGCDSLIVTNFFLVPSDTIVTTDITCDPLAVRNDSVFIDNPNGCDSLLVDIVNLAPSSEEEVLIMTCDVNQVSRDTLFETNIFGCDSIIIQNYQLLRSDTVTLMDYICDGEAFIDTSFLINSLGCDSMVITVFEEASSDEIFVDDFTCDMNQVGVEVFNLTNQFGCDSTVTVNFEFVERQVTILAANTCDPAQFMPDTTVFSTALCDSLVITNYNVQQESETILDLVSCNMDDVGTGSIVLSNQFGCDSVVTSIVRFADEDITNLRVFECQRMDTLVEESLFVNQFGCDSLVITTTLPGLDTTFNITNVCDPAEVFEIEVSFVSVEGCDSIVIDRGVLGDNFETVFEIFTCDEDQVGTTSINLTSMEGCDSIIIFNTVLGEIELIQNVRNIACGEVGTGQISVQGNSGQLPYLYNLDGGIFSASNVFDNLDIGVYQVGVQDADGCESFAELEITEVTGVDIILPEFVELDFGDPLTLNPIIEGDFVDFFWTGVDSLFCETCLDQNYVPLASNAINLNVLSAEGCLERHQVIFAVAKNYDVYIPNAFSPNDDSVNDFFMVYGDENIKEIKNLSLYTRWGEQVFEGVNLSPNDEPSGWNGMHKGERMNPGVFVYKVQVEFFDGFIEDFEGDFSLIR